MFTALTLLCMVVMQVIVPHEDIYRRAICLV